MRRKPNLGLRMEACTGLLIKKPEDYSGAWREKITNGRQLFLEIGCGKGRFAVETARNEPDNFIVGLELVPDALVMAMERASKDGVGNVIFIHANAESCTEFFAPGEVGRIFLNFSDPWPSNRHMRKRLTSEGFLRIYRQILAPGGGIFLKTDNLPFFEYSLMRFQKDGWDIADATRDLHGEGVGRGGVMTEYEEKFSSQGIPICYLEARLRDDLSNA